MRATYFENEIRDFRDILCARHFMRLRYLLFSCRRAAIWLGVYVSMSVSMSVCHKYVDKNVEKTGPYEIE